MFIKFFSIAMLLFPFYVNAGLVVITQSNGKIIEISSGFNESALKKSFDLLNSGEFRTVKQDIQISKNTTQTILFSHSDYTRVQKTFNTWNHAPSFTPEKLPPELVAEHVFHIHPQTGLQKFYFSDRTKKHPILHITELAECVAVSGYNDEQKQGFLAHIPYWDEDFETHFHTAIKRIQGTSAHEKIQLHLITLTASNISEHRLEMIQKLGFKPQVNAIAGVLSLISTQNSQSHLKRIVSPAMIDSHFYIKHVIQSQGRSIYFDTRNGIIYETDFTPPTE